MELFGDEEQPSLANGWEGKNTHLVLLPLTCECFFRFSPPPARASMTGNKDSDQARPRVRVWVFASDSTVRPSHLTCTTPRHPCNLKQLHCETQLPAPGPSPKSLLSDLWVMREDWTDLLQTKRQQGSQVRGRLGQPISERTSLMLLSAGKQTDGA